MEITPLAWQPGTATFCALEMASFWSLESSGNPYTQSSSVRWAVEDADGDIFHGLYHFFRGSVGKAEEHEVCLFCKGLNGLNIFSFIFRQMEEFYIFSFGQPVLKTESCGSRFTYNEYFRQCFHDSSSFQSMGYSPKVATMTALMVGSRLAASWKAREKGASNTSSVTSMPFRPKRS